MKSMTPSEFAFKSFHYAELSDFNDWALLSPSDWICFISDAVCIPESGKAIIDTLCEVYAPDLAGADGIVFYRNRSTRMRAVVKVAKDEGDAALLGNVHGEDGCTTAKRYLQRKDGKDAFAAVFATFDQRGKVVALSVYLKR